MDRKMGERSLSLLKYATEQAPLPLDGYTPEEAAEFKDNIRQKILDDLKSLTGEELVELVKQHAAKVEEEEQQQLEQQQQQHEQSQGAGATTEANPFANRVQDDADLIDAGIIAEMVAGICTKSQKATFVKVITKYIR